MGSCLFLRLWIWCISVFFNDKKKNLLKYTVEGRIKRNIKIKRERKQSQEREERKESKTKTQNFFCHWWCLRHARLVCWSWLLGVSLHVCSMNSGIPADESRFKEIELRGKSESFSSSFFFFFVFQLMFGNGSDDRAIVEAEGFLDPILRSVVSGFT